MIAKASDVPDDAMQARQTGSDPLLNGQPVATTPDNPECAPPIVDETALSSGPLPAASANPPGWAAGLQQLYNSVIEEDLPTDFTDLLKRLDGAAHE